MIAFRAFRASLFYEKVICLLCQPQRKIKANFIRKSQTYLMLKSKRKKKEKSRCKSEDFQSY